VPKLTTNMTDEELCEAIASIQERMAEIAQEEDRLKVRRARLVHVLRTDRSRSTGWLAYRLKLGSRQTVINWEAALSRRPAPPNTPPAPALLRRLPPRRLRPATGPVPRAGATRPPQGR
jgi:hypothetical protein